VAVLGQIAARDLVGNAERMGAALYSRLMGLMQRYALIGDVRGKGLLCAFELMADRATKAPLNPALHAHARLVDIAYDNGLIIYSRRTRGGTSGDHFLVCPPLITTQVQLDEITDLLDKSLAQYMAELPAQVA
jgi:4-aminobutyrate aminotransferase-like enzyme